jgi:hypothetical protein
MKTKMTMMTVLLAAAASAQVDTTVVKVRNLDLQVYTKQGKDSVKVESESCDSQREKRNKLTHWAGIDLGVNMMVNTSNSIGLEGNAEWLRTDPVRSLHWGFNVWEEKLPIVKDYVGIYTGAGLAYNSFGLADSVAVITGKNGVDGLYDTTVKRTKNKLRTSSLRVPLMLEFNTSRDPKKTVHLSAGVIGSWIFSTITKQEYTMNDIDYRTRSKADFHVNQFAYDVAVRLGYRNFTLFANHAMSPFFKNNRGPELYPLTVGVQLIPW